MNANLGPVGSAELVELEMQELEALEAPTLVTAVVSLTVGISIGVSIALT